VQQGCYVDIGAEHPIIDSVSKAFYEQGWRGVHIEPVSEYATLLRQDRPDETVLQIALSDHVGVLELNVFPDTGLSTGIKEFAEQHVRTHGFQYKVMQVPMLTMRDVLGSLTGTDVHWLKIDVEGLEEAVLRGWDHHGLRPWIVVMEVTSPMSKELRFEGAESILIQAGYRFVYFDGLNRFYISSEHPELAAAFESPPNVFDEIQLSASSSLCHVLIEQHQRERDEWQVQLAELDTNLRNVQADADARLRDAMADADTRVHNAQADADTRVRNAQVAAYTRLRNARADADARLRDAETQLNVLKAKLAQSEQISDRAQRRAAQAELLVCESHAQVESARHLLDAMLRSTSWRVSAPVRVSGAPLHRLTSALREHRLRSGIERRIKTLMNRSARIIARRPLAGSSAAAALSIHPPMEQTGVANSTSPLNPSPDWRPLTFDDLAPDGCRLYLALRAATQL